MNEAQIDRRQKQSKMYVRTCLKCDKPLHTDNRFQRLHTKCSETVANMTWTGWGVGNIRVATE